MSERKAVIEFRQRCDAELAETRRRVRRLFETTDIEAVAARAFAVDAGEFPSYPDAECDFAQPFRPKAPNHPHP